MTLYMEQIHHEAVAGPSYILNGYSVKGKGIYLWNGTYKKHSLSSGKSLDVLPMFDMKCDLLLTFGVQF